MAHVYLTGGLRIEGSAGSAVDADFPGSQGRLAFAILVLERRPLTRDQLAELVWDGRLPDRWDAALTTIVSKLRSLLVKVGVDGRAMLTSLDGSYAMRLTSEMWVDVEEALRRLDRAEGAWRHGDLHLATTDATVASSILRRTLLTGIDGEWVALQRRRLADCLYRSYIVLAQAWRDRGDAQLSVVVAQSAVDLDPHREVGHRLLASAELRRGDRGAALRALDRCERILADELGVAPSPETIELIDQLRR